LMRCFRRGRREGLRERREVVWRRAGGQVVIDEGGGARGVEVG